MKWTLRRRFWPRAVPPGCPRRRCMTAKPARRCTRLFIIPTAAIRDEGVSHHFLPRQTPALPTFKIQKFVIPVITASLFFASCGGGNPESLTDLKSKQAELKTQLAEITTKISKFEGDSAKKFTLVEASIITPTIFKTYINVQGRVDAEESVSLSSEMPGTITRINVKPGDEVSK